MESIIALVSCANPLLVVSGVLEPRLGSDSAKYCRALRTAQLVGIFKFTRVVHRCDAAIPLDSLGRALGRSAGGIQGAGIACPGRLVRARYFGSRGRPVAL